MQKRYKYTSETTGSYSKRHYKTTLMPTIKPKFGDIYLYAAATDRLDTLAFVHYGDSRYWWILALANNLGKGSLQVPVGQQLRIPGDTLEIESLFQQSQKGR